MKDRPMRRLTLARETLRTLTSAQQRRVAGAEPSGLITRCGWQCESWTDVRGRCCNFPSDPSCNYCSGDPTCYRRV
jgi:hypothetical protein